MYENIQYRKGMPLKVLLNGATHVKAHWHYGIEMILMLEGSLIVTVEDRKHYLESGDMILINSCENHYIDTADGENKHIVLQINPDFFTGYFDDITNIKIKLDPDIKKTILKSDFYLIRSCIARIVLEYKDKRDAYKMLVVGFLNEMLATIIRLCPYNIQSDPDSLNKLNDIKRLDRIFTYVNNNYTKDIKIHDIASREYLSIYYFSRYIKSKIGMTLQEYIMIKRIDKAKYLVLFSDDNISNISEECGFEDYKSFLRQFKKRIGCTPSEYRKKKNEDKLSPNEIAKITYKDGYKKSGTILQDLDDGKGYSFGKWDALIDWNSINGIIESFII